MHSSISSISYSRHSDATLKVDVQNVHQFVQKFQNFAVAIFMIWSEMMPIHILILPESPTVMQPETVKLFVTILACSLEINQ